MDLTNIYRTPHPNTLRCALFSEAHDPVSKVDHILGDKARLNKYRKIEIIPCVVSDHNRINQ